MPPIRGIIEHRVPGRTRLRIPALKGNAPALGRLAHTLGARPEVERIEARALTGSLLLYHAPTWDLVAESWQGILDLSSPEPTMAEPLFIPAAGSIMPLLETVLIGIFLALAGLQLYRGDFLEPASKLFWYALTLARGWPPKGMS